MDTAVLSDGGFHVLPSIAFCSIWENMDIGKNTEVNMYTETELAAIARRENNTKRAYLVVNRLQGKHIPVSPGRFFSMTKELAAQVREAYPSERLLLIGFAETATAIGAALALQLGTPYMHTTREPMENVNWLYFTESHSHATEQKLVSEDIAEAISHTDRIVFVEDEVTTGNTIMKIIRIIRKEFNEAPAFSVASLLNGMDAESRSRYEEAQIGLHWLVKTDHSRYTEIANRYAGDGCYLHANTNSLPEETFKLYHLNNGVNPRRLVNADVFDAACHSLADHIRRNIVNIAEGRILVIGTEECMYPALFTGAQLEAEGFTVRSHSTTRSPIAVSREEDYPLRTRYTLQSLYDSSRTTYLYDIMMYDQVIVLTDAAELSSEGVASLIHALRQGGNKNIHLVQWNTSQTTK